MALQNGQLKARARDPRTIAKRRLIRVYFTQR